MKKIGVLLPQSNEFPTIAKDYLRGLKLAIDDDTVDYKIESIGFANDHKEVIDRIQKLVNQEDVNLLTGILGHKGITEILDFVEGIEEKLLYSDIGATLPIKLNNRKGIYCNSFELLNSVGLVTNYFTQNELNNIAVSTCYYDAGYGFLMAMEKALNNTNGQFAGHFITPLNPRENEAELMAEFMDEVNPDVIFATHNGTYAKEHTEYLVKNELHKKYKLYTTPFSLDEETLNKHINTFDGVRRVSSWFPELNTPENEKFIADYTEQNGKKPSIFALLGYENGLILKHSNFNLNSPNVNPLEGPRGSLILDSTSHRTSADHHLWELASDGETYRNKMIQTLPKGDFLDNLLIEEKQEVGGWVNAYLCH